MGKASYCVTTMDVGGQRSNSTVSEPLDSGEHGSLTVLMDFATFISNYTLAKTVGISMTEQPPTPDDTKHPAPIPGASVDLKAVITAKGQTSGEIYRVVIAAPFLVKDGETATPPAAGILPIFFTYTEKGRRITPVSGQAVVENYRSKLGITEPLTFTRGAIVERL